MTVLLIKLIADVLAHLFLTSNDLSYAVNGDILLCEALWRIRHDTMRGRDEERERKMGEEKRGEDVTRR